jgi:hypothetical protein
MNKLVNHIGAHYYLGLRFLIFDKYILYECFKKLSNTLFVLFLLSCMSDGPYTVVKIKLL